MSARAAGARSRYLVDSPRARAEAQRTTARARRARARSSRQSTPPLYPLVTLLLLLLGAWTFLGVFVLGYPYTVTGQNSVLRELGAAIVLMLCALWLRQVRFSWVAAGLAGLVGAAMVWSAFALPHQASRIRADEGVVGALVVILCVAAAVTRDRRVASQPEASAGHVAPSDEADRLPRAARTESSTSAHRLSVVRAAWGCLLLVAPGWVVQRLRRAGGAQVPARWVLRVLGARQLAQAFVTARWPGRGVLGLGAGTDLLHAATATVFAASKPGRRVAGGVDTLLALLFAAAGWRARGSQGWRRRSAATAILHDANPRAGQ